MRRRRISLAERVTRNPGGGFSAKSETRTPGPDVLKK